MSKEEAMADINAKSIDIIKLKIEAARLSGELDNLCERTTEIRKKLESKVNEIDMARIELDGLIEATFRNKENL